MNQATLTKDRPWSARVSLLSGETSNTIRAGMPVVLSTTDIGKVVLPATAGNATANSLIAGIAVKNAAPGEAVEFVSDGYVANAIVITQTRAVSTDTYASVASRPAGAVYVLDTLRNGLTYNAASTNTPVPFILMESVQSIQSAPSSPTETGLYRTAKYKMWVRALV